MRTKDFMTTKGVLDTAYSPRFTIIHSATRLDVAVATEPKGFRIDFAEAEMILPMSLLIVQGWILSNAISGIGPSICISIATGAIVGAIRMVSGRF